TPLRSRRPSPRMPAGSASASASEASPSGAPSRSDGSASDLDDAAAGGSARGLQ
ncbi:unnamed protein product, partial [Prorocentrum cordatum]